MSNQEICKREYTRINNVYYSKSLPKETQKVLIGMYYPDGSTNGEFQIEWEIIEGKGNARLKAFDDGWLVLSLFKDLIDKMAEVYNTGIQ